MAVNPAHAHGHGDGQLNGENKSLRILSLETGPAVLTRVNLLVLHTKAESGAYSRTLILPSVFGGVHLELDRQPPSSPSRPNCTAQLRTNGFHRRESAGSGPAGLKVARVTGAVNAYSIQVQ